ncbi:MAG: hypothetical protein M3Q10_04220 [Chloroflexota bacterium]|nr:hypothetical protein [Chloroflexota bacterium]
MLPNGRQTSGVPSLFGSWGWQRRVPAQVGTPISSPAASTAVLPLLPDETDAPVRS